MINKDTHIRFPENLKIKGMVAAAGISHSDLAKEIGVRREVVTNTLNGHKKGVNVIPAIEEILGKLKGEN